MKDRLAAEDLAEVGGELLTGQRTAGPQPRPRAWRASRVRAGRSALHAISALDAADRDEKDTTNDWSRQEGSTAHRRTRSNPLGSRPDSAQVVAGACGSKRNIELSVFTDDEAKTLRRLMVVEVPFCVLRLYSATMFTDWTDEVSKHRIAGSLRRQFSKESVGPR